MSASVREICVVTGNQGKLRELQAIFPGNIKLIAQDLDLPEIQSLDSEEIIRDKLQKAYTIAKEPVIAEDVSAGLACLDGLPGPFVKYFVKKLGRDALWRLAEPCDDKSVRITCTMGYYDGQDFFIVEGVLDGSVTQPRGENGFGFDFAVVPKGEERTMAEMTPAEKNSISHRGAAVRKLADALAR